MPSALTKRLDLRLAEEEKNEIDEAAALAGTTLSLTSCNHYKEAMNEAWLEGRTALVTGASRGIGRATAVALARVGARIVITARDGAQLDAVAAEIGDSAHGIAADVSQPNEVDALFQAAGPVDILINCAGVIGPIAPVAVGDRELWRRNLEINLYGPYLTCQAALAHMLEAGWGRIINVSSGGASGRVPSWSAYSASKAGLEALTKVLAREVGDRGVHVNVVRPGIVDTEMQDEIRSTSEDLFGRENLERYRSYKERGVLRQPEDPAKLILWVLSPEANELNGEVLAIDDPETAARIGLTPIAR
jgi:NAD(P)-dependent dehydrogenase (short-subunit alcohol dehydrogenase family)